MSSKLVNLTNGNAGSYGFKTNYVIIKKPIDLNMENSNHLNRILYTVPLFTIVTTIVFVVFLVILLKKCRVNKTYSFDQDSIELDKVGSKCNISTTATNASSSKYGTLEENTTETNQNRLPTSSTWPFGRFSLKNFSFKSQNKNDNDDDVSQISKINEIDGVQTNKLLKNEPQNNKKNSNDELINKLLPIKLNYSIEYKNETLKLDILSIESLNKSFIESNNNNNNDENMKRVKNQLKFNPYVRIELINECSCLKNESICSSVSDASLLNDIWTEFEFKTSKTRVIRNTINANYNETFIFKKIQNLVKYDLVLSVYSSNLFTRDLFVGHLVHEFNEINSDDYIIKKIYSKELDSSACKSAKNKNLVGEITFSLTYKSSSQTICLNLIKANYLPYVNESNLPNPFAKLCLIYDNERLNKKLSKILMQTRNPVFNQSFEFDLSSYLTDVIVTETSVDASLKENKKDYVLDRFGISITILDWNPIEKCDKLGELYLSSQNNNQIAKHWNEIFIKPDNTIITTYKLNYDKND